MRRRSNAVRKGAAAGASAFKCSSTARHFFCSRRGGEQAARVCVRQCVEACGDPPSLPLKPTPSPASARARLQQRRDAGQDVDVAAAQQGEGRQRAALQTVFDQVHLGAWQGGWGEVMGGVRRGAHRPVQRSNALGSCCRPQSQSLSPLSSCGPEPACQPTPRTRGRLSHFEVGRRGIGAKVCTNTRLQLRQTV